MLWRHYSHVVLLLAGHCPPQQDDRTAGAKIAEASASTVDKFGILADAMVSRGALTNALQGRGHNNIDNDKDDGNQC